MQIVDTLAPVFLMIGLGALLRRRHFFDATAVAAMNRCCYWIGLPALLFLKIGLEPFPEGAGGRTVPALLGATGLLLLTALLTGLLLRQSLRVLATFLHVSFRGNLAYVGLPVVVYAFESVEGGESAGSVAAVALGSAVVVYNVLAVMLHLAAQHRFRADALRHMIFRTATNPLLLACVAGFSWQHIAPADGMPGFLVRTLAMAGQFALPLALLSVGCSLVSAPLRDVAAHAVLAASLKTMAGPAFGWVMARWLNLPPMETGVVCLMMATPTAIASYVLTEQLGGDERLAAGTIALSTLLSMASLSAVLALVVA